MRVMDRKAQSTISRWTIAAAIFGGICNLLSWVLINYQDYYLQRVHVIWDLWLIVPATLALLPLVVLFVFRHLSSVVFIYASVLLLILVWRVQHLVPYKFLWAGAVSYKIDTPGLLLLLLGVVSAAVLLVRAAIWFAASIRRKQRPSSAQSP
jgi:hypothetical protein